MQIVKRVIRVANGEMSVTSTNPKRALQMVVDLAISSGERPPKWWEYWTPRWPVDAVTEYHRQKNGGTVDE